MYHEEIKLPQSLAVGKNALFGVSIMAYPLGTYKKTLCFNFKRYNIPNRIEQACTNWSIHMHTSEVQDPTVKIPKNEF
jgi:hypothetical protein